MRFLRRIENKTVMNRIESEAYKYQLNVEAIEKKNQDGLVSWKRWQIVKWDKDDQRDGRHDRMKWEEGQKKRRKLVGIMPYSPNKKR